MTTIQLGSSDNDADCDGLLTSEDCDDEDAVRSHTRRYDTIDNDCDGQIDEEVQPFGIKTMMVIPMECIYNNRSLHRT